MKKKTNAKIGELFNARDDVTNLSSIVLASGAAFVSQFTEGFSNYSKYIIHFSNGEMFQNSKRKFYH